MQAINEAVAIIRKGNGAMSNPEPSSIKLARKTGFLIVDGTSASSMHLMDVWSDERERDSRPVIVVIRQRGLAELRYNLKSGIPDAWNETLQRDVEGFLTIELQGSVLQTPTTEGFYSPVQGSVQGLEIKHALHLARRLAQVYESSVRFERPADHVGMQGDTVHYIGMDAADPDKADAFFRDLVKTGAATPVPGT